jgi:hypothetical protein
MHSNETPLERARRRVAEAEARVKDQAARVEQAARWGQDTAQAKATLTIFEGTLRLLQEDLARLERATGRSPPN